MHKWSRLLCFKKVCFCLIHINTGVWRSELSPNDSAKNIFLNFVVRFEKIVLERNSANLIRSLMGIFVEFLLLFFLRMLKDRPCLVCLDIDLSHLQLLKKYPRGFACSFQLFKCMTIY